MNPLSPLVFWGCLIAAWFAFRCIARGYTQVRTERSLHRHSDALKGITRGVQR